MHRNEGVRNILAHFHQATPAELDWGLIWYERAHEIAVRLAEIYTLDVSTVAGVISALSPNNRWGRNLQDAEAMIRAHQLGLPQVRVRVSTYLPNKAKAWRLLSGADPDREFGRQAPKTRAFWRLIVQPDDPEEVVIDGHAVSIWGGERVVLDQQKSLTLGRYRQIAADYRDAAKHEELLPSQMQATTWLVYRRLHQRDMKSGGRNSDQYADQLLPQPDEPQPDSP